MISVKLYIIAVFSFTLYTSLNDLDLIFKQLYSAKPLEHKIVCLSLYVLISSSLTFIICDTNEEAYAYILLHR